MHVKHYTCIHEADVNICLGQYRRKVQKCVFLSLNKLGSYNLAYIIISFIVIFIFIAVYTHMSSFTYYYIQQDMWSVATNSEVAIFMINKSLAVQL